MGIRSRTACLILLALPVLAQTPGAGVSRTMRLLATSTPQHRKPVKILFYGQSITKQDYWKLMAGELRRLYPYADLTIVNRAIGGFSTQYLKRTIEHDLFPFYPDLVIFHDYGRQDEYEEMIRAIRSRTTAEVLLQTDHVAVAPPERQAFSDRHSFEWLRDLAAKYGLEWGEIRRPWQQHLNAHQLPPSALLRDNVHLNVEGERLMARLLMRYLKYDAALTPPAPVRDVTVGTDAHWVNGKLRVEFEGNRVELLTSAAARQPYTRARILIDGKPPSALPEVYAVERPSDGTGPDWPLFIRVGRDAPLLVEDWFLRVTSVDDAHRTIRFAVRGSRTGDDGAGISSEKFVSRSGRVVIEPGDWHFRRAYDLRKVPLPVGYEARWRVLPLFNDVYEPPRIDDRTREYSTLAASGLAPGKHVLELIAETAETPQIAAIRVYSPPLRTQ